MRKLVTAAMAAMVVATSLVSCDRAADEVNAITGQNGTAQKGQCVIKANIAGNHSTNFQASNLTSSTNLLNGMIMMTGTRVNGVTVQDWMTIMIPLKTSVGTHRILEGDATFTYLKGDGAGDNGYVAGADGKTDFTYKITKNSNGEIEGTFEGAMYNISDKKITLTSGTFSGKY